MPCLAIHTKSQVNKEDKEESESENILRTQCKITATDIFPVVT